MSSGNRAAWGQGPQETGLSVETGGIEGAKQTPQRNLSTNPEKPRIQPRSPRHRRAGSGVSEQAFQQGIFDGIGDVWQKINQ
ncbi:hypothetical protein GCM10009108_26820 [Castellaniella ginsengisoli]|uniref:Uncharacterized protein n=1 Tax=Castellaniella ginsengisoli TaxID=546114 RepID=A0ABP3WBD4_9BURK